MLKIPGPKLLPHNAAVIALREWLEHERDLAHQSIVHATEVPEIYREQGRLRVILHLLNLVDPDKYPVE